jgi:hypothetical protein
MGLSESQLQQLEDLELETLGQNPTEIYGQSTSRLPGDNFEPIDPPIKETERRIEIPQEPSRTTRQLVNPEALEDPNILQRGLGAVSEDFEKSAVGAFARGANDVILALPDLVINAIGASVNYLGGTEDQWDRNVLSRIFNSSDYESQKVLIPYVFNYGVGNFRGQGESEGAVNKYARIGGQGAGMALPFVGASGRAAKATTAPITAVADKTRAAFSPYTQVSRKSTDPYTAGQLVDDIGNQMLSAARRNPGGAAALEVGAGTLSTMGMQGEYDLFGTQTGLGGLLPLAAIPAFFAYSGTKYLADKIPTPLSPIKIVKAGINKYTDGKAQKKIDSGELTAEEIVSTKAGKEAQGRISQEVKKRLETDESQAGLARTEEITEEIPNLNLTPAEASLDPVLLNTQKQMFDDASKSSTTADLTFIDQQKARIAQNTEEIKRFQENIIQDPLTDSPSVIVDQVSGKKESLLKRIEAGETKVADSLEKLKNQETGALPRLDSRSFIGKSIRTALEEGLQNAKDAATRLANKLKINDKDNIGSLDAVYNAREKLAQNVLAKSSFVDWTNLRAERAAIRERKKFVGPPIKDEKPIPKYKPQGLKGGLNLGEGDKTIDPFIMNFINGPNEPLSFQNWRRLLDQTGDLLGKAINNNAKTKIKDYSMMREVLLGMGDNYGKLNSNFKTFQENYKKTVIQPYQTDVVYKVLNKQKVDQYILPDEKVASAFTGDSTSAKNFMEYFKDSAQMFNNMESAVLDEVRRQAWSENNGTLGVNKIASYLNKNRETLEVLKNAEGVSLYDTLSNTNNLLAKMLDRQKTLTIRRKAIESNLLMKKIAKAESDGEPEKILDEALTSFPLMKKLKQIASRGENSEGTLQAFRASVMQRLMARAEVARNEDPNIMMNPEGFKNFLVNNATILKEAFTPKHIQDLFIVANAVERSTAALPVEGQLNIAEDAFTKLSKTLGTSLPSLSSMSRSVAENRMSKNHFISIVATRGARGYSNAKQQALLREAMFNPKIADLLAREAPVGATTLPPAINRRLNAYLFSTGDTYGENPVEYYYPDREPVEEETQIEVETSPQPSIDPRNIDPIPAPPPPPPPMDFTQVAPPPNPAPTGGGQMDIASLFPFDTTSAAIQKRQQQKQGQGIGSLMG